MSLPVAPQPGAVWLARWLTRHPRRVRAGFAAALATVRALGFYCVTVALSLPLFVSMVLITPFELAFDKHRRAALHFVNDLWAVCSTLLFYRVEVSKLVVCGRQPFSC